jgi:hypothetical protein
MPLLCRELCQASFTDMSSRGQYYSTLMWVVHQLCTPELAPAIMHTPAAGSQVRPLPYQLHMLGNSLHVGSLRRKLHDAG